MQTPTLVPLLALIISSVWPTFARAEGPFRNRDSKDFGDPSEGTYPVPYQLPKVEEITEILERVHGYLEKAVPTRVIHRESRTEITDFSAVALDAVVDRGENDAFYNLDYTLGVVHEGMLLSTEATGDPRFKDFTARRLQFISDRLPYFRAQAEKAGTEHNSFHAILAPAALDDCGSMCAALIAARLAHVGPDLQSVIDTWADFIRHKQFRLSDGTLARQRPQRESLWADDIYMSIPALAQMGRLTGDRAYFDDAVKNMLQFGNHLFNPQVGLFAHGINPEQPSNPEFYWGRANGWALMTMVELLGVLPPDHPGRDDVLKLLRAHIKGIAQLQSGTGLWHQLLDRTDSYLETSASAMFVYGIARAIDQGWINPIGYGSIAQAGWIGVSTQVNLKGQVEGTCVGTTFASDAIYYYNRPTSVYATHGYGPVLLAGAEMIRLRKNPRVEVQLKYRSYHYSTKP